MQKKTIKKSLRAQEDSNSYHQVATAPQQLPDDDRHRTTLAQLTKQTRCDGVIGKIEKGHFDNVRFFIGTKYLNMEELSGFYV